MAAPIQLKANTPGGNSYRKSASAQKPYHGKPAPMATKPAARPLNARRSNVNAKGTVSTGVSTLSAADMHPKMVKLGVDRAVAWVTQHGLKNAMANKPRTPFANVPADLIGAGTSASRSSINKPAGRRSASVNPSGKTTTKRVNVVQGGRNFKSTRRTRIVSS